MGSVFRKQLLDSSSWCGEAGGSPSIGAGQSPIASCSAVAIPSIGALVPPAAPPADPPVFHAPLELHHDCFPGQVIEKGFRVHWHLSVDRIEQQMW
jgi:hypothetical protein